MTIANGFSHDEEHFVLFIQNKDGKQWNQFVRGLCSLYFACENDTHRVNSGMIYAKEFVARFYSEFLINFAEYKRQFKKNKEEIIESVANELLNLEYGEFEIGNVVDYK